VKPVVSKFPILGGRLLKSIMWVETIKGETFPILGGRLLKTHKKGGLSRGELVSNPWREAIEELP